MAEQTKDEDLVDNVRFASPTTEDDGSRGAHRAEERRIGGTLLCNG